MTGRSFIAVPADADSTPVTPPSAVRMRVDPRGRLSSVTVVDGLSPGTVQVHIERNGVEPMSRFFYANEIARPEDVIRYLAKQERHWRKGYSAYELAHSWIGAEGIPSLVGSVLDTCPDYAGAALVEGLFERDVDLRTPGRRSQTDLLAFVKLRHGDAVIAVEGKVDEPFGDWVSAWNDHSPGKERRLAALCMSLGLRVVDVEDIRYQLLHRTASAIYEAQRYRTTRSDHAGAFLQRG